MTRLAAECIDGVRAIDLHDEVLRVEVGATIRLAAVDAPRLVSARAVEVALDNVVRGANFEADGITLVRLDAGRLEFEAWANRDLMVRGVRDGCEKANGRCCGVVHGGGV